MDSMRQFSVTPVPRGLTKCVPCVPPELLETHAEKSSRAKGEMDAGRLGVIVLGAWLREALVEQVRGIRDDQREIAFGLLDARNPVDEDGSA
jgi:hypothetical protein